MTVQHTLRPCRHRREERDGFLAESVFLLLCLLWMVGMGALALMALELFFASFAKSILG